MKYLDTMVTFSEFPDEIALCINITNCPCQCSGCHSPELWEDIGTKLTYAELDKLIENSHGISCVGLMGGDIDTKHINDLAFYIKNKYPKLKVGWYSGINGLAYDINLANFEYIKLGSYIKELGPLDNPKTNQRFYHIENRQLVDWTYKFWKHGEK